MLRLSQNQIMMAGEYIDKHCRPLEKARYNYLFNNGSTDDVIGQLKMFQNRDGGFGNGLECDFMKKSNGKVFLPSKI